jgi:uncharacterized protein YvpB
MEIQRRAAPLVVWFVVGIVLVLAIGTLVLGVMTWQRAQQVEALLADVAELQAEQQDLAASLSALRDRLALLEESTSSRQPVDPTQEIEALRASLAETQSTIQSLQVAVDELAIDREMLANAGEDGQQESLPPQARLLVARQRQSHNLSCESSAASMVAQFHGVSLSEADVLAALPRSANPHLGFRGNVDGPTGSIEDYGVYAGPVMTILNGKGLQARPVEGGLDGIKAAVARGNPVIAWVTYDCLPSTPSEVMIGDEPVTLVPYQHVVVVIGYSPEGVWANDPWDGQEDSYPTADFVRAMSYFGDMALEVAAP